MLGLILLTSHMEAIQGCGVSKSLRGRSDSSFGKPIHLENILVLRDGFKLHHAQTLISLDGRGGVFGVTFAFEKSACQSTCGRGFPGSQWLKKCDCFLGGPSDWLNDHPHSCHQPGTLGRHKLKCSVCEIPLLCCSSGTRCRALRIQACSAQHKMGKKHPWGVLRKIPKDKNHCFHLNKSFTLEVPQQSQTWVA